MDKIYKNNTLYQIIFKESNLFLDLFLMAVSVMVLGFLSNFRIPLWPVPVTLQTFGVFAIAFFFGSRKGALTILLYLLTGVVGFSVFSGNTSGFATLLGPTGGYLFGFLVCVYVVGKMIEQGFGRTKSKVIYAMIVGNVIIYLFGLIGLWIYLGNVNLWQVLTYGLFPFLIGDAIKIIGAIYLFPFLFKNSRTI